MGLFSKKEELYSPVDGELKPITESSDEMFSSKAMGDGFMVAPSANEIYSPIKGKVVSVFPTKHAITFKKGKNEYLLHLGIDTVELNGEGFDINVSENESVDQNTLLGTVDFDLVKQKGKKTDVMFICTNLGSNKKINLSDLQSVKHSDNVGSIE